MIDPRTARRIQLATRAAASAVSVFALGVVFMAGPRPSVEWTDTSWLPAATVHIVATALPDSIAAFPEWFATQERAAGVTDPDVAKRVLFADSAHPAKTRHGRAMGLNRLGNSPHDYPSDFLGRNLGERHRRACGLHGLSGQ
jgi:hypothetical protein